jgi:hypothetical protein
MTLTLCYQVVLNCQLYAASIAMLVIVQCIMSYASKVSYCLMIARRGVPDLFYYWPPDTGLEVYIIALFCAISLCYPHAARHALSSAPHMRYVDAICLCQVIMARRHRQAIMPLLYREKPRPIYYTAAYVHEQALFPEAYTYRVSARLSECYINHCVRPGSIWTESFSQWPGHTECNLSSTNAQCVTRL